jgi:TolA-binding protein
LVLPKKISGILILVLILSGCVYYNTFFNAKKYFRLAQETPLRNERPTSQAKANYTKSIQRCAYIIEEYPSSKWVDDALFLLGRCFFYRGNNYRQAIETFEELIDKFPASEFVPEAHIYIAKSNYALRNYVKAKSQLQEFVSNSAFAKHHPEALLLISNYYMDENNPVKAQEFLQTIIDNFPKSEEYQEAFLLQAKTYQEVAEYEKSNQILNQILQARVDKNLKLKARYLIAQNHLDQKNYETAIDIADKLVHEQYTETDRAQTKLILARSYAGFQEYEKAKDLFLLIVHENPRTEISAEAYYYLAEMLFHDLKNYSEAIEYYNSVRQEYSASEYVSDAITKSAIASQIVQYRTDTQNIDVVNLSNQQFKLAEYFIFELDFPDSALVIYDEIIENKAFLQTTLDSLETRTNILSNEILQYYPPFQEKRDSLAVVSEMIRQDTLLADSTRTLILNKMQEYQTNSGQLENMRSNMDSFRNEIIPFAYFCKIWLYENIFSNTQKSLTILNKLKSDFPDNRYTFAAENMLQGESVEFITREEISQKEEYETAIDNLNSPQSISILKSISENEKHLYFQESLFLLGYLNYFQLADSLQAKTYFDSLINLPEYKEPLVRKLATFYDGENFKQNADLNALEKYKEKPETEDENSETEEETGEPEQKPEQE